MALSVPPVCVCFTSVVTRKPVSVPCIFVLQTRFSDVHCVAFHSFSFLFLTATYLVQGNPLGLPSVPWVANLDWFQFSATPETMKWHVCPQGGVAEGKCSWVTSRTCCFVPDSVVYVVVSNMDELCFSIRCQHLVSSCTFHLITLFLLSFRGI